MIPGSASACRPLGDSDHLLLPHGNGLSKINADTVFTFMLLMILLWTSHPSLLRSEMHLRAADHPIKDRAADRPIPTPHSPHRR